MIPAYFIPEAPPPDALWNQMEGGMPTVQIIVANKSNGPGIDYYGNFGQVLAHARQIGIIATGYVNTARATRPIGDVKADIDRWYSLYGVDGIYFDNTPGDCGLSGYYAELNYYVKAKGGLALTILGLGSPVQECWVRAGDILLTWELPIEYIGQYEAYPWMARYPSSRFWHLIYSVRSEADMIAVVGLTKGRGARYVFVTPNDVNNAWTSLPTGSYWTNELIAIKSGPQI
jgi:hypothetical protein